MKKSKSSRLKIQDPRLKYVSLLPFHVCLFTCLILLVTACDEAFQPVGDSQDSPFSMFGFLDASADTQWVRVTPLRDQVDTPGTLPDMRVTLEHSAGGGKAVMKDSLFQLIGGSNAVNVYSSELDIIPRETYRIRAERSDGASSQVTVTIPPDFPTPVLITSGFYDEHGNLYLKDLEKVADVQTLWRVNGEDHRIPYRVRVRDYTPPEYDCVVNLDGDRDVSFIFDEAPPPYAQDVLASGSVRRQVFAVSGGPDWMESIIDLEDQTYSLPEVLSNVENGVGYVIGIVSKTIPYKTCRDEEEEVTACPVEKPMF